MGAGKLARASVPVLSGAGINAVPIAGLLLGGWPPETTMMLYIVETALLVAVTALRLQLLAPAKLETTSGRLQDRSEAIQGFLLLTGSFTFGGAVFSASFLWRTLDVGLTARALAASVPASSACRGRRSSPTCCCCGGSARRRPSAGCCRPYGAAA